MKTKLVALYVDLAPGWQDWPDEMYITLSNHAAPDLLLPGYTRVKVTVELPCIGGTALATVETEGRVEK